MLYIISLVKKTGVINDMCVEIKTECFESCLN